MPLLSEIIKQAVNKLDSVKITCVSKEAAAIQLSGKSDYDVIIFTGNDLRGVNLNQFYQHLNLPNKVIVFGWDEDQIAVYSRSDLKKATLRNLTSVLTNVREQLLPGRKANHRRKT